MLEVGEKFKSKWFEGIIEVMEIDKENNTLLVSISRQTGFSHEEDWNLEHTMIGFIRGDYFGIEDD